MKKIHITESQLVELSRLKLNEQDTALGATGNVSTQTSTTTQQGQTPAQQQKAKTTVETPKGTRITTDPTTNRTTIQLGDELKDGATTPQGTRQIANAEVLNNDVKIPDKRRTTVYTGDPNQSVPVNKETGTMRSNILDTVTQIKQAPIDNIGGAVPFLREGRYFTKKDILEAKRQRLISESTPYTKGELFGVIAESGKMYNFKFNDGETYKVSGDKVDDFRKYVFEHDGSREGKDYIIEKIGQ